jgi:thiaminase
VNDASSFSERMRASARRTWDAALDHRFFREVATDAVDDRVFARYLRIEYGFVDTAAKALGYAVGKAPSFGERRRLGLGLYGLVTDQENFFIDAFERMGAKAEERTAMPPHGLALHAGGAFADHVAWVRAEIDDRGPRLAKARQAWLMALFERALEAEIAFHDATYAA